MFHRQVIAKNIGKTIYAGRTAGESYHCFTDYCRCPLTQRAMFVPGRGAFVHSISSFFFSRLQALNIPTHFVRKVNMRESLVYATTPLPFETLVRCAAIGKFAESFSIPEGTLFDRPIIEHVHTEHRVPLNESHIFSFRWLDAEDMDDLQILASKILDFLRGMFMGHGFYLMEVRLLFGKSLQDGEFFLAGDLSPESFCVMDVTTKELFGRQCIFNGAHNPVKHYQKIAERLGIRGEFHDDGKSAHVFPFVGKKND